MRKIAAFLLALGLMLNVFGFAAEAQVTGNGASCGTGICGNAGGPNIVGNGSSKCVQGNGKVHESGSGCKVPFTPANHVITVDYLGNGSGKLITQPNDCNYDPYLSYDYPGGGASGTQQAYSTWQACSPRINTIFYASAYQTHDSIEPEYKDMIDGGTPTAPTGTYACAAAKTSGGAYVTVYSGTGDLFDPHHSCATSYWNQALSDDAAKVQAPSGEGSTFPDCFFEDNYDDLLGISATPSDDSGLADWTTATNNVQNGVTVPHATGLTGCQIVNTLSIQTFSNQLNSLTPAAVTGGEFEGCFTNSALLTTVTDEIQTVAKSKVFLCYSNENGNWQSTNGTGSCSGITNCSTNGAGTVEQQRVTNYAAWLLGYDIAFSWYQTWFATGPTITEGAGTHCNGTPNCTAFDVMPETQLVAYNPETTASSSVTELESGTTGLYFRVFDSCYYAGTFLGKCEAVVNEGSSSQAPPNESSYHHSMTCSGSDILDNGTCSTTTGQVTSLAVGVGAILLP